jgi:hypothetical protein
VAVIFGRVPIKIVAIELSKSRVIVEKNTNNTKLHDPSTLGFALGRFFLRVTTFVLMVMGLILVFKYPNDMKGLYFSLLGWGTYFITALLSPRLVPEPPKGE